MIISKKKFERMVEEEVQKRMNAADEKRWQDERIRELESHMYRQFDRIHETMCKFEEKLEGMNPKQSDKPCNPRDPMNMVFRF